MFENFKKIKMNSNKLNLLSIVTNNNKECVFFLYYLITCKYSVFQFRNKTEMQEDGIFLSAIEENLKYLMSNDFFWKNYKNDYLSCNLPENSECIIIRSQQVSEYTKLPKLLHIIAADFIYNLCKSFAIPCFSFYNGSRFELIIHFASKYPETSIKDMFDFENKKFYKFFLNLFIWDNEQNEHKEKTVCVCVKESLINDTLLNIKNKIKLGGKEIISKIGYLEKQNTIKAYNKLQTEQNNLINPIKKKGWEDVNTIEFKEVDLFKLLFPNGSISFVNKKSVPFTCNNGKPFIPIIPSCLFDKQPNFTSPFSELIKINREEMQGHINLLNQSFLD